MEEKKTKWGSRNKMIFKPSWARWKLHLQIADNRWREYYSYDYHNVFVNAEKYKLYIEEMALLDMIARVREKNPTGYKYGNVFGNFTDDLSTSKKNYDKHVFTMTPTKCTWKQKIFYFDTAITGSAYISKRVDVAKTLQEWTAAEKMQIVTPDQARAAVYLALNNNSHEKPESAAQ